MVLRVDIYIPFKRELYVDMLPCVLLYEIPLDSVVDDLEGVTAEEDIDVVFLVVDEESEAGPGSAVGEGGDGEPLIIVDVILFAKLGADFGVGFASDGVDEVVMMGQRVAHSLDQHLLLRLELDLLDVKLVSRVQNLAGFYRHSSTEENAAVLRRYY